jgi:hypothetical protein
MLIQTYGALQPLQQVKRALVQALSFARGALELKKGQRIACAFASSVRLVIAAAGGRCHHNEQRQESREPQTNEAKADPEGHELLNFRQRHGAIVAPAARGAEKKPAKVTRGLRVEVDWLV